MQRVHGSTTHSQPKVSGAADHSRAHSSCYSLSCCPAARMGAHRSNCLSNGGQVVQRWCSSCCAVGCLTLVALGADLVCAEKRKLNAYESIEYFAPNSSVYRKWLARQVGLYLGEMPAAARSRPACPCSTDGDIPVSVLQHGKPRSS